MDDRSRTEDDRNKYGTRSEGLVPAQNTLGGAAVSGHVTGGGGGKEGRQEGGREVSRAGWLVFHSHCPHIVDATDGCV